MPGPAGHFRSPTMASDPHPRRTFAAAALGAGLLASAAGLSGCVGLGTLFDLAVPAQVPGLTGDGWAGLPLRAWISRDGIRAEAMTGCFAESCKPRLVVGVFTASGQEARTLAGVLDEPARLRTLLARRPGKQRPHQPSGPLNLGADPIQAGPLRGFLARISRGDGSRPVAMAALGTRGVEPLRFVLVVGEDPLAAESVAREVAAANITRSVQGL
jgi:hypothetical protein